MAVTNEYQLVDFTWLKHCTLTLDFAFLYNADSALTLGWCHHKGMFGSNNHKISPLQDFGDLASSAIGRLHRKYLESIILHAWFNRCYFKVSVACLCDFCCECMCGMCMLRADYTWIGCRQQQWDGWCKAIGWPSWKADAKWMWIHQTWQWTAKVVQCRCGEERCYALVTYWMPRCNPRLTEHSSHHFDTRLRHSVWSHIRLGICWRLSGICDCSGMPPAACSSHIEYQLLLARNQSCYHRGLFISTICTIQLDVRTSWRGLSQSWLRSDSQ